MWKLALYIITPVMCLACAVARADEMKVPLTFSGGLDTDPQDHGRPVVLVAAGLGVKPEVFREAFRGVTPARRQTFAGAGAQQ